ncbi:hypothetical protein E1202_07715 [Saccharopolyspora karakumensis]|uniref:Uncharacterized protein n=1 Tax=Saccharopolyspora karakumensis TaxID=2530386 RepID=A0A4R5BV40_9PSEU|nr:hypothetical protein [Saccharopolyspora karakumensis]TDD90981.1 hypothetical protein E1202_07715 [Saccharopolyspora karakumensis]
MPEHCALLTADTIESGGTRPEHLGTIPHLVETIVAEASSEVGLAENVHRNGQFSGDGFLRAYPSQYLPALIDLVASIDALLIGHNLSAKPEIRLRIALHLGPLPTEFGLYRPNIDVCRLLEADEFHALVERWRSSLPIDRFTTALILSDDAHRAVFGGDYTRSITRHDFGPVNIKHKEFDQQAWVRIAGVNPAQLTEPPRETPTASSEPVDDRRSAGHSISNGGGNQGIQIAGDGNHVEQQPRQVHVNNLVGENNYGISTGHVSGSINYKTGESR